MLHSEGRLINETAARLAASIIIKQEIKLSKGRKNKWVKNFQSIIGGNSYYGIDERYLQKIKVKEELIQEIKSHKLYDIIKLR